jgi:SsrA-binding protein
VKITNKKALHDYHIMESLEAGVELYGHEVKSIREGRLDLGQAFVRVLNNQLFLVNAHIPLFKNATMEDYQANRSRRLLAHRSQIDSLIGKISGKGVALVPVSVYDKNNFIKVQVGLGKSKKEFDKRRVVKERDHKRRVEQELKGRE